MAVQKVRAKKDISGSLTRATIRSSLTPLLLLVALALGLMALMNIAREEEPQISVPLVDVRIAAPGLSATDVVEQVSKPLEEIFKAIPEVEHVYSIAQDDGALVTARFNVGTDADDAILRIHEKINANINRIPPNIPVPQVIGRGINDVPIVTLTLIPEDYTNNIWNDTSLRMIASELQAELTKIDNIGLSTIIGGRALEIRVEPDVNALAAYGVSLQTLVQTLRGAANAFPAGISKVDGKAYVLQAGDTIKSPTDIEKLKVRGAGGRQVYVSDITKISVIGRDTEARAWSLERKGGLWHTAPAVTLALAKRPGANAVKVSEQILSKLETLKGSLIPDGLNVHVTRNYGETANHKANELLFHLGLATISIVVLIALMIGQREALVTLIVIPTTILLTIFASYMMGFTINRVSLFALIFSIGILVDDAIVIIENIARHWGLHGKNNQTEAAINAVSEVGNPTIIATLTVICALMPMTFVSGLMGPYMAPIPAIASAAMIFSFFVAVIIAPWLIMKLAPKVKMKAHTHDGAGKLGEFYAKAVSPIIKTRKRSWIFLILIGLLTLLSMTLFATKTVRVKLLPFDNKSEMQIVVDLPEGAALEDTERALFTLADAIREIEEIEDIQAYAGTAAPINFNGLVRHYFLRQSPEQGDLQINLSEKSHRKRTSHAIALDIRERIKMAHLSKGANVKVVEVPPGPPVISTLLAEIYAPDPITRRKTAAIVKTLFEETDYIVDVDDSIGESRPRLVVSIDAPSAADYGVLQQDILDTIAISFGGKTIGASPRGEGRNPLDIRVTFPRSEKIWSQKMASIPVPRRLAGITSDPIDLGAVVNINSKEGSPIIFRRDGHFVDMVQGELAGRFEAPIYGMFEIQKKIDAYDWAAHGLDAPVIRMAGQPEDETKTTLLWDGEWEITFVTFRDMGIAFGIALVGIFILVVAQFGSFKLPLVILAPVPLTLIGIMFGHWLFGAPFSATSMIGFISLAGIIVRNSILLVDFVRNRQGDGHKLKDVLIEAGMIRFKPILLTALAAMIGAVVILSDPIFQGLAISLLFGLLSSTVLTVLVIPAIYVAVRGPDWVFDAAGTDIVKGESYK
ncbi:MAG: efflux RND transporter permease subunit [Robiginitomaculum sp.]